MVFYAKATMKQTCAVGLNWDGAMYDGLNVSTDMAVDCISLKSAHLPLIVPCMLSVIHLQNQKTCLLI